ncbi:hypothetical protein IWQ61_003870 [Dispira simplex]|nr:hypothetical protein IWQ61_003870 [Dispira simplex]
MTECKPSSSPNSPMAPLVEELSPPLSSAAVPTSQAPVTPNHRRRQRYNVFGHYVLMQTIGEGEFAKVKFAVERQTGHEVAIKLIKKESIDTEAKLSKINREIAALKTVQHSHIVQLYEILETDRYIGIVMEYASGGELFDYILAHRFLREKEACRLFAQLISGVDYLHKSHIVHRDLKLENLLLDNNRNLKITDFGFANQFERASEDLMATSCGSPCYAAPELVVNDGMYVGTAVDIWSCGVILYAMLAGYLPFDDDPTNPEGDNINQLYRYILSTPLVFPDYISALARDLLRRMLVPDPEKRCDIRAIMAHEWLRPYLTLFYPLIPEQVVPDVNDTTLSQSQSSAVEPILPNAISHDSKAYKRHTIQVDHDMDVLASFVTTQDCPPQTTDHSVPESVPIKGDGRDAHLCNELDPVGPVAEVIPDSPIDSILLADTHQDDVAMVAQRAVNKMRSILPEDKNTTIPVDSHVTTHPTEATSTNCDSGTELAVKKVANSAQVDQPLVSPISGHCNEKKTIPEGEEAQAEGAVQSPETLERTTFKADGAIEETPTASAKPANKRRKAYSVLLGPNAIPSFGGGEARTHNDVKTTGSHVNPAKRVMEWLRRKSTNPTRLPEMKAPRVERVSTNPSAALSGDQLPESALKYPDPNEDYPKLRLHRGAVDQNSLTSRHPDEVFAHIKQVVQSMGLIIYKESDYKIKCVRPARRQSSVGSTYYPVPPDTPVEISSPAEFNHSPVTPGMEYTVPGKGLSLNIPRTSISSSRPSSRRPSTSHGAGGVLSRLSIAMGYTRPQFRDSSLHPAISTEGRGVRASTDCVGVRPTPADLLASPRDRSVPTDTTSSIRKRPVSIMRFIPFAHGTGAHRRPISVSADHANVVAAQRHRRGIFGKQEVGFNATSQMLPSTASIFRTSVDTVLTKASRREDSTSIKSKEEGSPHNSIISDHTGRTGHNSNSSPLNHHHRNKSTGTVSFVAGDSGSNASGGAMPDITTVQSVRISQDSSRVSSHKGSVDQIGSAAAVVQASPSRASITPSVAVVAPLYGEHPLDAGGEVRLTIDICKLKNLPHLLTVRVRRQRGNIWSYKFLYNEFLRRLGFKSEDLIVERKRSAKGLSTNNSEVKQDTGKAQVPPTGRSSATFPNEPGSYTSSRGSATTSRQAKRTSIFHPANLFSTTSGVGRLIGRGGNESSQKASGVINVRDIFGGYGRDRGASSTMVDRVKSGNINGKVNSSRKTSRTDVVDVTIDSEYIQSQEGTRFEQATTHGKTKTKLSHNDKRNNGMASLPPLTPLLTAIAPSPNYAGKPSARRQSHAGQANTHFISSTRAMLSTPLRSAGLDTNTLSNTVSAGGVAKRRASVVPGITQSATVVPKETPATARIKAGHRGRSRAHSASVVAVTNAADFFPC